MESKYIARLILSVATAINLIALSMIIAVQPNQEYDDKDIIVEEPCSMDISKVHYLAPPEMIDECLREFEADRKPCDVKETKSENISYTVIKGDSLWSIAEKFYGDGSYYPYIIKTNNINGAIHPGNVITIYHIEDYDSTLKECYKFIREENNSKKSSTKRSANNKARNYNVPNKDSLTFIGNFKITGYDAYCKHCCGKTNGITASGTKATVGRTVAAKGIPFGTKLYIEGYGTYIVEDRGGFNSNLIDMVASSHEEAYTLTANNVPVYRVN